MVKIVLVEDHLVVRNGIKLLLDSQDNLKVVAEANDGAELLTLLEKGIIPDVLITDINMPNMDGLALTSALSQRYPAVKVILLSMLDTLSHVIEAFDKGAKGYLVKNVGCNELLFAVNHVANGCKYLCEELAMKMVDLVSAYSDCMVVEDQKKSELDLSDREIEVLQLISEGYTNMEIADKLFLSKRTVEGHRQNLIDKMKVKNSASLVKYAVKNRLIQ